jgi:phage/plasmid-like protein (TIGR03299 family)
MAHLIETMAYTGQAPWHQLGHALPPKQSLDVWADKAGMNWSLLSTPVRFIADGSGGAVLSYADQKVLYRSDTKAPLSVVSDRYQVVQPREVLEFYRDLAEVSGFELETAGVLKQGRKFWALARTGKQSVLKGKDAIKSYILLATSCDGTLATTAMHTSVRVVCNNTLSVALQGGSGAVKVPHNTTFDPQAVKKQLGVAVSQWDSFIYRMKTLSERKIKSHEAMNYFLQVVCDADADGNLTNERALKRIQALYEGQGKGSELEAAKGTAWGLLNAVTQFVDHEKRSRSQDYRLDSAWFGQGASLKQRALDHAMQLVS